LSFCPKEGEKEGGKRGGGKKRKKEKGKEKKKGRVPSGASGRATFWLGGFLSTPSLTPLPLPEGKGEREGGKEKK